MFKQPETPSVSSAESNRSTVATPVAKGQKRAENEPTQPSEEVAQQLQRCNALYENMKHDQSLQLTKQLRNAEPLSSNATLLQISNLVEMKRAIELFTLGHELVELRADWPLAWYAVAAYYYTIHRFDQARVYLDKCLGMSPAFGPGWVMLGHSFAAHDEHDRAMNCYIKAAKVLPSHLYPLLYIGLTYLTTRSNEVDKALAFFESALDLLLPPAPQGAETDGNNENAPRPSGKKVSQLRRRLQCVLDARWEPIVNNAAHACRLLQRYDEAVLYHEKSLLLRPNEGSTYLGLAMCQALTLNLEACIELLLKASSTSPPCSGEEDVGPGGRPAGVGLGPQPIRAALDVVMGLYATHPNMFVGKASGSSVDKLWVQEIVPDGNWTEELDKYPRTKSQKTSFQSNRSSNISAKSAEGGSRRSSRLTNNSATAASHEGNGSQSSSIMDVTS